MNSKIYRQADSRWGKLPYPTKAYSFAGNGCGCCAVTHCVIELDKYKNYTPADVRKYMVQFATKGHGTLWNGITKGLEHYEYNVHWRQADSMSDIFKVLKTSLKRGVILFGSSLGPDGTRWTASGHYIAFVDYKIDKNGKHWFYLKDSGGRKHDKWWCYEKSMRGDVRQVWICTSLKSSAKTTTPKTTTPAATTAKAYSGTFPSANNNAKIVNGLAYRMCYPYGTPQKKYTFKDGKPKEAYKKAIDKVFPNHKNWSNKKQKVGACCDILPAVCLGLVGIKIKKDLKDQLTDMPKMTKQLKSNGVYKAGDFKAGMIVQRGRKDKSGHTFIICQLVNGKKYIANAHYKKLKGTYAVMDSVAVTQKPSKWKYYKCYTVLGACRTYYKNGDYGYDVKYIQAFLKWYGIACTVDGDFGDETEDAVKEYQRRRGLTVDGKVGEETIADMKKVRK